MVFNTEEEKFDLVFRAATVKGVDLTVAKRNMGLLFKIDARKVEALFSGKAVVLKRGLSIDAANKYRVAIKKAGALVDVEMQKPTVKGSVGKASFDAVEPSNSSASQTQVPGAIPGTETTVGAIPGTEGRSLASSLPDRTAPQRVISTGSDRIESPDFDLAPVGANLLRPEELTSVDTVTVDTSALSLRGEGGKLLDDNEYRSFEPLDVDLNMFDLAAPGADVLKPEERKAFETSEFDLSEFSLAAPGGNLAPPKPPAPAPPDVSNIRLEH